MIYGETRTIRHTETGESAFTFDETPTLAVTKPDDTAVDPAPTVTVSPGTSAVTQTLSASVAFSQAGEYRMVWSMDVGAQDPILRIETYFAAWTDVYALIRGKGLLNRTATQLTDEVIDAELVRLTRAISSEYTCLGDYGDLTGADRYAMDEALVYMISALLRPILPLIDTGVVKRKKQDGIEVEYVVSGSNAQKQSIETEWISNAWKAFRRIDCITDIVTATAANFSPFSLHGRRRAAEKAGNIVSDTNPILRLLLDEERRMLGTGVYD